MPTSLKIDVVSDISCPWCAVGLSGLERALEALGDKVEATITFHPFELSPNMPPEGQNIVEYVAQRYGSTLEQSIANRDVLRARAASVGFDMPIGEDSRMYNTFDAHRLLHWAKVVGGQLSLKHALFEANFTRNLNVGDREILLSCVAKAGLDAAEAAAVLGSDRYAAEVRGDETLWKTAGISSVPAMIINDQYLISGGQTPEYFETALRKIANI